VIQMEMLHLKKMIHIQVFPQSIFYWVDKSSNQCDDGATPNNTLHTNMKPARRFHIGELKR